MNALLWDLLKQTSRTFYKTLRILPGSVRSPIGLAYLLARTTDTIADTALVPVEQRLEALQKLRERILGTSAAPLNFSELSRHQSLSAEKLLLENIEPGIAGLDEFSPHDTQLIREALDTITSGQALDLQRFSVASNTTEAGTPKVVALQTEDELDDYTYRVAGCVGEFWTKMCRAHLFPNDKLDDVRLLADGVRFGKGLQLVNILRDLPADLRNGRCYLPADKLAEVGLMPSDLLQPANESRLRPLYDRYLDLSESHLAAGWEYTNVIPYRQMRVRLACAWPILIGVETIKRLRVENLFEHEGNIKISRSQVRAIIARSMLVYPFPGVWKGLFPKPVQGKGKDVARHAGLA